MYRLGSIRPAEPRSWLLTATACAVAALAVAGCGSSSGSTSSSSSSDTSGGAQTTAGSSAGGSSAISSAELAKLQNVVNAAQKTPKWTAPGPAVSAKVLSGKTIVTFPISSEADACTTQQSQFQAAASSLGAKVDSLAVSAPGGPSAWTSDLQQALSDHAAAVVIFCGATAAAIAPELKTLEANHVPVIDSNYNETDGDQAFPDTGLQAETGSDTAEGVEDDLADALVNLQGAPAHILFLDSPSIAQYEGAKRALSAAISRWCPSTCSIVKEEDVEVQNQENDGGIVASDLNAHKNVNAVISAFDTQTDDIVTQVQAAAASHPGIKIYSWGTGKTEVGNVANNPVMAADAGPDNRWIAYGALDQVIRLLNGKPAVAVSNETAPNVFFTKANAKQFGDYSDAPYGGGVFVKDFDRLWGVS